MDKKGIQYTLRNIPKKLDHTLRKRAEELNCSLNEAAIDAMKRGVGLSEQPVFYHDLDHLAGQWEEDPAFNGAIKAQDKVDPEMWK